MQGQAQVKGQGQGQGQGTGQDKGLPVSNAQILSFPFLFTASAVVMSICPAQFQFNARTMNRPQVC